MKYITKERWSSWSENGWNWEYKEIEGN